MGHSTSSCPLPFSALPPLLRATIFVETVVRWAHAPPTLTSPSDLHATPQSHTREARRRWSQLLSLFTHTPKVGGTWNMGGGGAYSVNMQEEREGVRGHCACTPFCPCSHRTPRVLAGSGRGAHRQMGGCKGEGVMGRGVSGSRKGIENRGSPAATAYGKRVICAYLRATLRVVYLCF